MAVYNLHWWTGSKRGEVDSLILRQMESGGSAGGVIKWNKRP